MQRYDYFRNLQYFGEKNMSISVRSLASDGCGAIIRSCFSVFYVYSGPEQGYPIFSRDHTAVALGTSIRQRIHHLLGGQVAT